MEQQHDVHTLQLEMNGKLQRMMDGIDSLKEKQEEMAEDVSKIKEAVYHPDEGLYARLRELEQWKKSSSKVIWMLTAGILSLLMGAIKQHFLN
tara:strand:+ start:159 stop:437 length:279 start_codon:yes stop_codon:yes gene_type:complete